MSGGQKLIKESTADGGKTWQSGDNEIRDDKHGVRGGAKTAFPWGRGKTGEMRTKEKELISSTVRGACKLKNSGCRLKKGGDRGIDGSKSRGGGSPGT